jgi:hypothetical protein
MSTGQLAELELEVSQMDPSEREDELQLLSHKVRFWRQKAWRTEQQLGREVEARVQLEKSLEKYKYVTDDMLENINKQRLATIRVEIDGYFNKIGFLQWRKLCEEEQTLVSLEDKIALLQNAISLYNKKNDDD